jgi:hypothetical protein
MRPARDSGFDVRIAVRIGTRDSTVEARVRRAARLRDVRSSPCQDHHRGERDGSKTCPRTPCVQSATERHRRRIGGEHEHVDVREVGRDHQASRCRSGSAASAPPRQGRRPRAYDRCCPDLDYARPGESAPEAPRRLLPRTRRDGAPAPGGAGESGLQAGVLEKRFAGPPMLDGDLRQQQPRRRPRSTIRPWRRPRSPPRPLPRARA